MFTKKCPYCAEEIQQKAIVCKFCHKDLPGEENLDRPTTTLGNEAEKMDKITELKQTQDSAEKYKKKCMILWGAVLILFFYIRMNYGDWAFLSLLVGLWFHPLRNEKIFQNRIVDFKKHIVRSIGSLLIILVMLWGVGNQLWQERQYRIDQELISKQRAEATAQLIAETKIADGYPEPKFTLMSAEGDQGANSEYELKFSATDTENAYVDNSWTATMPVEGIYTQKVPLDTQEKLINVVLKNKYKEKKFEVKVTRNKNAEELRIEKEAKSVLQQEEKDNLAYEKSPAGKLCNKHTDWTKSDCDSVVKNLVWIGMSLDMLKVERGNPSSVNVSNYGSGDQYQWCWYNWNNGPSCFYGDMDGIVTTYN